MALLSEVYTVASRIIVMPATNAVSERSFSALRHLKTYLRSTMNQGRLNNVMILHVHKQFTDDLCLADIGNDFVRGLSHRETLFGKFLNFILTVLSLHNSFVSMYTGNILS